MRPSSSLLGDGGKRITSVIAQVEAIISGKAAVSSRVASQQCRSLTTTRSSCQGGAIINYHPWPPIVRYHFYLSTSYFMPAFCTKPGADIPLRPPLEEESRTVCVRDTYNRSWAWAGMILASLFAAAAGTNNTCYTMAEQATPTAPLHRVQDDSDDDSPSSSSDKSDPPTTTATKKKTQGPGWKRYMRFITRQETTRVIDRHDQMEEDESTMSIDEVEEEPLFRKVYDVSVCGLQGNRQYMEDRYYVDDGGRFVAVFDGHGGEGVAAFLRDRLYKAYVKYLAEEEGSGSHDGSWLDSITSRVNALHSAFDEVEDDILQDDELQYQGSTAVVVVMQEQDDGHRTLVTANVGDSRAILSRQGKAIDLSHDHKPENEQEWQRIKATGEKIKWDDYAEMYRVRNLSVSRSIGDRFAKPVVSGEVEVKGLELVEDGDEFFLLASDGVWDVMTSQDVVNFVHEKLAAAKEDGVPLIKRQKQMTELVAREALRRGSADNVSCAIVWLK